MEKVLLSILMLCILCASCTNGTPLQNTTQPQLVAIRVSGYEAMSSADITPEEAKKIFEQFLVADSDKDSVQENLGAKK